MTLFLTFKRKIYVFDTLKLGVGGKSANPRDQKIKYQIPLEDPRPQLIGKNLVSSSSLIRCKAFLYFVIFSIVLCEALDFSRLRKKFEDVSPYSYQTYLLLILMLLIFCSHISFLQFIFIIDFYSLYIPNFQCISNCIF